MPVQTRKRLSANTVLSILLLIVFVLLLYFGISLVRTKLLQNTQVLGTSLAQSYAAEEEMHIATFRNFLELGVQYVEELTTTGAEEEEIQQWLHSYFSKLALIIGENVVDPYAVINGEIIAANPWEGDAEYNYAETSWYQEALEANGEMVYTDAYQDAITGELVVTAAMRFAGSDNVLAMDIFPSNFHTGHEEHSLPEEASYYLVDSAGTLIYTNNRWHESPEVLQNFTDQLVEGISSGELYAYDASFRDLEGVQRGAYYYEMSNGWKVILTVPFEEVLIGERNVTIVVMVVISVILFLILAAMVVRDIVNSRKMAKADNTIHILGDSFYAIYRVNYQLGNYETIKCAADMGKKLPPGGNYQELLEAIKSFVEPSTYKEFEMSFALDSIRQRVAAHVADYGGDYQRRFGDTYKWVNIRTLYDGKLAPDEVILCFREVDIEKRQQLQHTLILQEALETAKKSTKAKTAFFSSMSHDMRTPLNAIIGLSELAQKSRGDWDKVEGYMRKIEFSGKQLLTLINDILELSRLESGRNTLEYKEFDIRKFLEEGVSIFRDQALREKKDLSVQVDIQDDYVMGDAFKLGQILNNLMSNAIKYSEPGDSIMVSLRQYDFQQHSKYQLTVEDTGIGMSENFLKHIFDPYARETHFATRSTVGTGLGMPIVKSLVQQMSGEITVESVLGQGSRFTVTLPMATVKREEERLGQKEEEEAVPDLRGRRILLAEDNELNMEIATEMLTMNGMEVVQACNGAEAVALFQSMAPCSFDAILMDMQMPEMDGCEAARAIRLLDKPDAKTIPIVAVTANAFAEDIAKTTEAGMNGHISKPIDFAVLCRTLEELIRQREERNGSPAGDRNEGPAPNEA